MSERLDEIPNLGEDINYSAGLHNYFILTQFISSHTTSDFFKCKCCYAQSTCYPYGINGIC